ncbi:MAG: 4-phosphoerythronate dehydrogenase [Bacteroidota bacterium]
MKIIADKNIPFIKGVLEPWADVEYHEGSRIGKDTLAGADALIVRTRTRCDKSLLQGTGIQFIGTATIGTDHIDLAWCRENGIRCCSAPGCNSGSVMQYVASVLAYLVQERGIKPAGKTLGLIGVGNVGSKVAAMARVLGYNVLLNDPPRERKEGKGEFSHLNRVLAESDIISMHVPLTYEGPEKTYQIVNDAFISKMKDHAIFINTSRGQVADEKALMTGLAKKSPGTAVIDVWRNEPVINPELLKAVEIGTAHIAGYSLDGKANGTKMIIRQLAEHFGLPLADWEPESVPLPENPLVDISGSAGSDYEIISGAILHTYRVEDDSGKLKKNPASFEKLRNDYPPRREFHAYRVKGNNEPVISKLRALGFI